jgi:hypothetical protein
MAVRKRAGGAAAEPSAASGGGAFATFKDLATIVPIVHLLVTGCYLFGYGRGFGRQIVAFMTLNDLFVASLRAVGLAYLLIAVPVLIVVLLRARDGRQARRVPVYAAFLLVLIGAIGFALSAPITGLSGRTLQIHASLAAMGALLLATFAVLRRMQATGADLQAMAIFSTAMLFAFALALGYNKGLMDRGRTYGAGNGRYFQCEGGRLIIRSVGAHYLTVDRAGKWVLVDGNCQPRFHLDAPPPAPSKPRPG